MTRLLLTLAVLSTCQSGPSQEAIAACADRELTCWYACQREHCQPAMDACLAAELRQRTSSEGVP